MTPAIIYTRFSAGRDRADSASNRHQFQRCRAYCEAHDYQIVGVHWDREKSGRDANRPGLQRALDHACREKAVLLVAKLDRLTRRKHDAFDIAELLGNAGADLASVSEQIDTHSPMGRACLGIISIFNQLERETINARTSEALRRHQYNGRRVTRMDRCPYGFRPNPDNPAKMAPEPTETRIRDKVLEMAKAEGMVAREIAFSLNTQEVPYRSGKRWDTNRVAAILRGAMMKV